jgi:hypothetical protein
VGSKQSRFAVPPTPSLVNNYFIEQLFFQNADLIETQSHLADLFRSFFNDKPAADFNTYTALVKALKAGTFNVASI